MPGVPGFPFLGRTQHVDVAALRTSGNLRVFEAPAEADLRFASSGAVSLFL
jgi:hypothetical protein